MNKNGCKDCGELPNSCHCEFNDVDPTDDGPEVDIIKIGRINEVLDFNDEIFYKFIGG